ncbi:hypothetical protein C900_00479 [Fulvivirga imtechensis AK7]|uniref:SdiA-regulated family protein n=1 Tax=Fulvivirga imtechensis AK7 TaxID=1237149 RepID=L8K0H1_9BACT|nr:hypothetical protein C900_00479 [Fulvivirga imtechensis AK7]
MKLPLIISANLMVLAFFVSHCNNITGSTFDSAYVDYDYQRTGYKFYEPAKQMELHNDLVEISGLGVVDDNTLAAVEDETGHVYLLSTEDGSVLRKIKFGKQGDYEGVELIGDDVYVLKSNGTLYSFKLTRQDEVEAREIETVFSSKNDLEGLGHDGQSLLIACKASGNIDGNKVKGKAVYRYYIPGSKLITKEVVDIEKDQLSAFVNDRSYFNEIRQFDPSAIAKHPISKDIYILSADHILVILSADYQLKEVVKLDKNIYKQPEGISFASDGTMYISNEGKGGKATLVKLLYNNIKK